MEHLLKVRKNSHIQEPVQRIIIGVAGGSAAGKTTLCENINRQMAFDRNFRVQMVSLDSFYKSLDTNVVNAKDYNFDHPNALDFDLAYQTLKLMKESNQRVPIPQYSFIHHQRLPEPTYANPANIILFQGLMAFHDQRIRDLMTYKVFITCDDDIRLCRRIKRDTKQRGRTIQSVLLQYNRFVKDSFRNFIQPTMVYADIIIPGFRNNRVSVDFIVQHIKNIARRINYRETASRTKIYIFGENQLYDFEYRQSPQVAMTLGNQSFLVFPTSQQHKKQLQFFMNRLISETFSQEYYEQVIICQFIKIQKSLLNQLIELKEFKKKDIEVFAAHHISGIETFHLLSKKVKVVYFPIAYTNTADKLIHLIKKTKQKSPDTVFVILTIFCDMNFPRIIYKIGLSNVILINLFIIANEKRFKETMFNNIILSQKKVDWLENDEILSNQGAFIIANDLKLNYISQLSIQKSRYNEAVKKQHKQLPKRSINPTLEIFKPFYQKQVYAQQHQNLCGYHTLANIIMLSKRQQVSSKQKFLKYYHILSSSINNNNYSVLQRNQVNFMLQNNYFHGLNIGVFQYSSGYVLNTIEQLNQIEKTILSYITGHLDCYYLIMEVYDHFFLLEFPEERTKGEIIINLYDSANISLTDIMNGTDIQYKQINTQTIDEVDLLQHNKHMKNSKQALQVIQLVTEGKKRLIEILLEKRIQLICVPFLQLKDESKIENFFRNEYPIPVIIDDLLKPLKKIGERVLSEKYRNILSEWRQQPAIKWAILASMPE